MKALIVPIGACAPGETWGGAPTATFAHAARPDAFAANISRTTLGRLAANVPAMFLGDALDRHVRLRAVRGVAAASLAALAVLNAFNIGELV